MSATKLLWIFVALTVCGLAAGCGDETVAPIEDEAPILPPANVSAQASSVEKLLISWDASSHPQLRGYHVYRMELVTGEAVRLTNQTIPVTRYQDLSARRGVGYEYRVTAVTQNNKESTYTSVRVMLQAQTENQESRYHGREL